MSLVLTLQDPPPKKERQHKILNIGLLLVVEYFRSVVWALLFQQMIWLLPPLGIECTSTPTVNYHVCFLWSPCSLHLTGLIKYQCKSRIMRQAWFIWFGWTAPPSVPMRLRYVCVSCVCVATEKEEENPDWPHKASAWVTSHRVMPLLCARTLQDKRVWRHSVCRPPSFLFFSLLLALSCLYPESSFRWFD